MKNISISLALFLSLFLSFSCGILTHNWHFHGRQFRRHWATDWYLQWRYIKGGHIVLATSLIVIVDNILAHIIVGSGIFDVCLAASIVDHKYQNEYCEVCREAPEQC